MSERNTVAYKPGANSLMPNPRIIEELEVERDAKGAISAEALRKDDWVVVNELAPHIQRNADAAITIKNLLEQNKLMGEVLKNRILVALAEAKEPAWVPTHRHYKGKMYRVTGERQNADHEELEPMVEYDDAEGNRFVISKRRWESRLESGRPRYEFIYQRDGK